MMMSAPAHQRPSAARGNAPRSTPGGELRVSPAALWILHREAAVRERLAERIGVRGAHLGDPRDAQRDSPTLPRAVVLGVSGDFEAELEFAYQMAKRAPELEWLVVADSEDLGEAERLFDTLPGGAIDLEAEGAVLREHIRGLLSFRSSPPLSERQRRSRLTERFTRWHADLELPALFAATDPKRVRIPVLIRGEVGTGRGVLARYLHQLATGIPAGPFVSVPCAEVTDAASLRAVWTVESGRVPSGQLLTLCLEQVDALPPSLQEELARWIEYGAPGGFAPGARVRWIATAGEPPVPSLGDALAGLDVSLPSLREDGDRIERVARETARAWCLTHELPERELSADALARLRAHHWPGNLRELESTLARSLAISTTNPLPAEALDLVPPIDAEANSNPAAPPDEALARARENEAEALEDLVSAAPEAEPFDLSETPSGSPPLLQSELIEEEEVFPEFENAPEFASLHAPLGSDAASPPHPVPDSLLDAPEMTGAFGGRRSREGVRRLAGALAHEIGNPLVGIRSFAQMLPRRFEDPEFRRVAALQVSADTARIDAVLETLARLGNPPAEAPEAIDLSALTAGLLAERRTQIQERGFVVLEELDREHAWVSGNREQLRGALVALFDAVFELLPERGDLYVATQGSSEAGIEEPFTRALIRFSSTDDGRLEGLSRVEQSVGVAAAALMIEDQGGNLVLDLSEAPTALVLFELPSPPSRGGSSL